MFSTQFTITTFFSRKVAFELLLGTAVVNSWIVFNKLGTTKLGITEFRRKLADELISTSTNEPVRDVGPAQVPKKRTHTFVKPEGPGRKKKKVCTSCYRTLRNTLSSREADRKVRRVTSFCQDCPNMPGFCLQCFNNYHS